MDLVGLIKTFDSRLTLTPTFLTPILQDFESCVRRGDKECTYKDGDERQDFGQLTEFFCGQDDECT